MKNIFILLLLMCSCTSLEKEYNTHLKNGLKTYGNVIDVNLNFIDGVSIKKIAFIKKSDEKKDLVIRLNDNIKSSEIERYSLAIKTYLDKEKYKDILNGKEYISTPIKPNLLIINEFKYIITPYNFKIESAIKIEFFLFDRDKFRKVLSKPIIINNISI